MANAVAMIDEMAIGERYRALAGGLDERRRHPGEVMSRPGREPALLPLVPR